jgi:hypothetical protein
LQPSLASWDTVDLRPMRLDPNLLMSTFLSSSSVDLLAQPSHLKVSMNGGLALPTSMFWDLTSEILNSVIHHCLKTENDF